MTSGPLVAWSDVAKIRFKVLREVRWADVTKSETDPTNGLDGIEGEIK